ncbi:MAG: hypothetical protein ACJA04_000845 [Cellvibrionaceae bacterium]|jgi:hypothetical protein
MLPQAIDHAKNLWGLPMILAGDIANHGLVENILRFKIFGRERSQLIGPCALIRTPHPADAGNSALTKGTYRVFDILSHSLFLTDIVNARFCLDIR